MPISRLKNLIILILLAATAFLLALVIPNRLAQSRQRARQNRELIDLFAARGIFLSETVLPQEEKLYTVELPDVPSCGGTLAARLLRDPVSVQDAASSRDVCSFQSSTGYLRYDSSGWLSLDLKGAEEFSDLKGGSVKFLKELEYTANDVSAPERLSAGVFRVCCTQRLFDVPVFSEPLSLTYTNNCLTHMEGTFFCGLKEAVRIDDTLCISCADALVSLLSERDAIGWVGSSIVSVRQGYRHVDTAASSIRMSPCWQIVTDAGAFYVNGITGEVTEIAGE